MGHLKELLQNPHSRRSENTFQVIVWPSCCGATNPQSLVPVPHALVVLICTTEQQVSNHCICGSNVKKKKRIRISIEELTTIIIISIINVCFCKNYYSNIFSLRTFYIQFTSIFIFVLLTAVPRSCWPLTSNRPGSNIPVVIGWWAPPLKDVG